MTWVGDRGLLRMETGGSETQADSGAAEGRPDPSNGCVLSIAFALSGLCAFGKVLRVTEPG